MKVKLVSVVSKWEYEKVRAVTFFDYSNLILPGHTNFSEVLRPGKIYILCSDRSILTFMNTTGVAVLTDDLLQISSPGLYLSKDDFLKNKLQPGLAEVYKEIIALDENRFEARAWVDEDKSILTSV